MPLCAFGMLCHVNELPIHKSKSQFQWVEAYSQATGVCSAKVEKHGLRSQSAGFRPSAKRPVRHMREAVVNQGAGHRRPWLAPCSSRSLSFLFLGMHLPEGASEGWAGLTHSSKSKLPPNTPCSPSTSLLPAERKRAVGGL